jgi:hypothetical protein
MSKIPGATTSLFSPKRLFKLFEFPAMPIHPCQITTTFEKNNYSVLSRRQAIAALLRKSRD